MIEILLTTMRHLRGDAFVDRGWVIKNRDGRPIVLKEDGTEVLPVFCPRSLYGLRFDTVHYGHGFEVHWSLSERCEAHELIDQRLSLNPPSPSDATANPTPPRRTEAQ